ncbi:MAG: hypothetical protein WKF78_15285 [Candidatus Limnocylindrales bacterium]
MTTKPLTVAVVGATGVVGGTMIRTLVERGFPIGELRLLASERSAGQTIDVDSTTYTVIEATPDAFHGVDIALFSAGGDNVQGPRSGSRHERCHGHRQLIGLADGPHGPARRESGQPGRPSAVTRGSSPTRTARRCSSCRSSWPCATRSDWSVSSWTRTRR